MSPVNVTRTNCTSLNDACDVRCSTVYSEKSSEMKSQWRTGSCEDDMCEIDDKDDSVTGVSVKFRSALLSRGFNKSFNPMSEPADDWPCNFEKNEEVERNVKHLFPSQTDYCVECPQASGKVENNSAFPSKTLTIDDDDEATESKIRAFLDEKALDLKKLQTPLYEEFYNSISAACHPHFGGEKISPISKLTSKSRSPKRIPSRRFSAIVVDAKTPSPGKHSESSQPMSNEASDETQSSQPSEWKECCVDSWQESVGPSSASFSERQRKWKEELDEELERKRAVMRQAGAVGKMSSPKGFFINRQRDQFRLPGR